MTQLKNLTFTAFAAACVLSACQSQNSAARLQSDKQDILAQSALFSQAYVANDDDTMMSVYADNAVIAPPQRHFITEQGDLKSYWTTPFARTVTAHKATPEEIIIDNNLAYDWGYYEGVGQRDGTPQPFDGKYLIVWKRSDDGTWRMVQDMWN